MKIAPVVYGRREQQRGFHIIDSHYIAMCSFGQRGLNCGADLHHCDVNHFDTFVRHPPPPLPLITDQPILTPTPPLPTNTFANNCKK